MLLDTAWQEVINTDTDVFLFLNGMHNAFFDSFMSAYSGKWIWVPMYLTFWYVMLRNFSWKVTLLCMVSLALVITFADQVCATFIRPFAERMRPSNLNNPISGVVHVVDGYRGGRYGFPSCHAANTFGLAFFIFFLFRRKWLTFFMLFWAVLTCYSRVYLGVHYPGDLLVGALIGWIGAWGVYRLFLRFGGHQPPQRLIHVYAPMLTGGVLIVCMIGQAMIETIRWHKLASLLPDTLDFILD